ncbi:hypothetical protein, partial [Pseudomonas syringae]|uniref:hypothetical protein n=1 Tax=Pseudomonas syringae TaxID=317 RepID=UPI001F2E6628
LVEMLDFMKARVLREDGVHLGLRDSKFQVNAAIFNFPAHLPRTLTSGFRHNVLRQSCRARFSPNT